MPRLPGNPNIMSIVYTLAIIALAVIVLAALRGDQGFFGNRQHTANQQAQQMGGLQWGP